ncbi:MAG: hypothetical protein J6Y69_10135 [Treponema sp.]|nr:hypothetical protein [Treponema sp.]
MFEKEALYYGYHQTLGVSISEMKQSAYDWQKGAEFGYNKCKDELVVKTKEIAMLKERNAALSEKIAKTNRCLYEARGIIKLLLGDSQDKEERAETFLKMTNWSFELDTDGSVLGKENTELRRIVNLFKAGYDEDGHYMLWFENVLEQADRFLED